MIPLPRIHCQLFSLYLNVTETKVAHLTSHHLISDIRISLLNSFISLSLRTISFLANSTCALYSSLWIETMFAQFVTHGLQVGILES